METWEQEDMDHGEVRSLVKTRFVNKWILGMQQKSRLVRYRVKKRAKGMVEGIYDNGGIWGSRMLADARAGMLRTRQFRSRISSCDVTCQLCKNGEETIEHVVLNCIVLGNREGVSLEEALGLEGGTFRPDEVCTSKSRLTEWMVRNRAHAITT